VASGGPELAAELDVAGYAAYVDADPEADEEPAGGTLDDHFAR
jgi:hypothetical protein